MTDRRRFQVVPPDWGETHLTLEAVVAYVDDELASGPHDRATRHLERCADCVAEVAEQRRARSALRGADAPTLPPSLMSALRSIPQDTELPPPPAGLSLTQEGELVSVLRPAAFDGEQRRSRRSRRMRLGTGAAVSGIALGALAFGLPAATSQAPAPAPGGQGPGAAAVARFATTPTPAPRQRSTSAMPTPGTPASPTGSAAPGTPAPTVRNAGLPFPG
ncbi:anti-sigma factor family protein [Pseudonocardia parietis]|uniref:Anti-sigma factor RsiW n=1 Tax=Pseudonocardia parietis TaxID=570936 RepID=A0ABS4W3P7_9PSEU|nr:zf-HC2 domain-containing protein [Pseudonocardia parietis]MBP2370814.1 anti-sigma factor RsiW [Pseudonocardia parietis]